VSILRWRRGSEGGASLPMSISCAVQILEFAGRARGWREANSIGKSAAILKLGGSLNSMS
jgi:hypothetical protein